MTGAKYVKLAAFNRKGVNVHWAFSSEVMAIEPFKHKQNYYLGIDNHRFQTQCDDFPFTIGDKSRNRSDRLRAKLTIDGVLGLSGSLFERASPTPLDPVLA
jgi:hypothetical protein